MYTLTCMLSSVVIVCHLLKQSVKAPGLLVMCIQGHFFHKQTDKYYTYCFILCFQLKWIVLSNFCDK